MIDIFEIIFKWLITTKNDPPKFKMTIEILIHQWEWHILQRQETTDVKGDVV